MLPFLEALNPWNSCFTVTNFEDALIDIADILKTIDPTSNQNTQALSYQEKKSYLEKAFNLAVVCLNASSKQKTDKQLSFFLADILRQYATLCYHDHYFAAKQLLVVSLNLHLYTIGVFNECIDLKHYPSLEDLKKQSEANPLFFYAMEQSILSTSTDRCVSLAYKDSFLQPTPKKRLYSLAETTRWLGHCYQNINQTKTICNENDLRFSQLFGLSESLHLFIDDEYSKHALADLYVQAWPFMHQRKHPLDIQGTCQLYEKALTLNPSTEMQMQVAMKRFLTLFSNGQKKEATPFIQKALELSSKIEDKEENRFILFSLYDTCASYRMDPETLDLKDAGLYLTKAYQYVNQCKIDGREGLPIALLEKRYAEYKCVMGEFKAAKEMIERSLTALRKQPQSQLPYLYEAEALKRVMTTLVG